MDLAFYLIPAVPLLPLLAAAILGLLGPRVVRSQSHWPAIVAVAGSAASSAWLLFAALPSQGNLGRTVFTWFTAEPFVGLVRYLYDPLAAVMLVTVTGVSLLVIIYSRGYMKGDRGYARFFAFMALFVFSMCTLVLAGNFLLLYAGWELVGLCSYLLIGFYYRRPAAAAAAKKAFIVTRIGDFGMALGIFLIWQTFGSLDYETVLSADRLAAVAPARLTAIALLLFCGAVGKSAQLPLHVWLPDAMEGPSPVSALIHAATMVTAGIYLVARAMPLFAVAPNALLVVGIVGGATALLAALMAAVNLDLKRVLAYSTISQLGYMFLGLGAAAGSAAVAHLFTHAMFKALLFLGAGAVMHSLGGVLDLRRMGGLYRIMPLTGLTFLAGALSLAAIPLTAGAVSKDVILESVFAAGPLGQVGRTLGVAALATAFLTGYYSLRLFMRVFAGPTELPAEAGGHAHRPDRWMVVPLVVLAVGAIVGGLAVSPIRDLLARSGLTSPVGPHWVATAAALAGAGGAILAVALFGPLRNRSVNSPIGRTVLYRLPARKFYFDEIYDFLFVRPLRWLANACIAIDDFGIDNLLLGITWVPRSLGSALRLVQRGSLGGYALAAAAGTLLLIAAMRLFG